MTRSRFRPFTLPEKDTLPAAAFHPLASEQQGRLYPATADTPVALLLP